MPFEAFLTQGKTRPRKARWLTGSLSLTFHGGLVVAALVYSFWHVDELSPPTVTVTFLSATPPPPPPPPPKRKSAVTKVKPTHEIVQPKPKEIVQPKAREEPKEEKDEGEEGGVEGGVAGGVAGGVLGGVPPPPPPPAKHEDTGPKILSGNVGAGLLLTDPSKDPRHRVTLPPTLNRPGVRLWALIKICVSREGNVTDVKMIKGMDPSADPLLKEKAMNWKYKPYTIDGRPVPFCYPLRYDHQVQ